ncbi:hypothetical protein LVJ94_48260 [Pendulispora rubella]|uniref:Lipoprotein n=1 Tax=Pendulispora rubella TaxID=2741070 RepID=A0ABZ2L7I4_9BACT
MKKILGILSFACLLVVGCAMQDQGDPSPANQGSELEGATPNGAAGEPQVPLGCCRIPCPGDPDYLTSQSEAHPNRYVTTSAEGFRFCCEAC